MDGLKKTKGYKCVQLVAGFVPMAQKKNNVLNNLAGNGLPNINFIAGNNMFLNKVCLFNKSKEEISYNTLLEEFRSTPFYQIN